MYRRVEAVRKWRSASDRETTKGLAATPAQFAEVRQPSSDYLAMPTASSEKRQYIPIAFLPVKVVASNQVYIIPTAGRYHFGVLTSIMHMAWVRTVCGRIKSDYRYSAGIVYNNFPWPTRTDKQSAFIEKAAQEVLDARDRYPGSSLADLYDPVTMPADLAKAHKGLDKAVDAAYGKTNFANEAERMAFLFERYQQITAPLDISRKKVRKVA